MQRDARAFQSDAIWFAQASASIHDRLAYPNLDSPLAQYSPDTGCHSEIALATHIEENRTLAICKAVEPRDDALIAIPIDPALGRKPIRAILTAATGRALCWINEDVVRQRTRPTQRIRWIASGPRLTERDFRAADNEHSQHSQAN